MMRDCFIEQLENQRWQICYLDGTKAYVTTYATRGWATRTLNELKKEEQRINKV